LGDTPLHIYNSDKMARGNQRDKAREKNLKEAAKKVRLS
jgi:hypothetical protein